MRHDVSFFSAFKHVELKLCGQQETRSLVFDKPGVVAMGCEIHDSTAGFVGVIDTLFTTISDAEGRQSAGKRPSGLRPATVATSLPGPHRYTCTATRR